jgi:hypothetical protein
VNPETWEVLGLAPVRDRDAIRRAYARRLKVTSPEDDAEGFRVLREAYEQALASLDWDWAWGDTAEGEEEDGPASWDQPAAVVWAEGSELLTLMPGARLFDADQSYQPATLNGHDAHEALLAELEQLVAAPAGAAPLEAALAAILASPAMEDLAVAVHTEQRIAHLISGNAPRSDTLVRPAINAFRWSRDRIGRRDGATIEAVLDRDADIVFRTGVLRDEGPRRTAFMALTRPLNQGPAWHDRFWPGFEPAMRAILAEINTRRPSLRADLNPDTLAAWEERLDRPNLSPMALWIAGLAPLFPALFALGVSRWMALGVYMIGAVACLAVFSAWIFGVAPLHRAWRETWEWRAPIWARAGWSPVSLALLAAAVFVPAGPWTTLGIGILAALTVAWAVLTCEIQLETSGDAWPAPLQIAVNQGALVAFWIGLRLFRPDVATGPLTVAFAAAAIASAVGISTLPLIWFRWFDRAVRVVLTLGLTVGALGAAWLAFRSLQAPELTVFAVAATTLVVIGQRAPSGGLGSTALQWRYRAMVLPLFGFLMISKELGVVTACCFWLLTGTVVSLIGALFLEKDL